MTVIFNGFAANRQGWKVSAHSLTQWTAEGGDPGGYLGWQDTVKGNSIAYYKSSEAFRGDLSAFVGGELSYDVFDRGKNENGGVHPDIIIIGANGTTLYADTPTPGPYWVHTAVSLGEGDLHVGALDGPIATTDEISGVLADVAVLKIRADYHTGLQTGGLDNVTLLSSDTLAGTVFQHDAPDAQAGPLHFGGLHDTMLLHVASIPLA